MKKIHLLFLEDQEMDVFLIKKVLERSGMEFTITIAENKKQFIAALEENAFDIVLADHSLPQFSAMEALELTKEKKINKPFILVTGTVSEEFAVQAMKDGAWDYILKDRLQRLPTAIKGAMDKYYLETEKQNYLDEVMKKQALMNEAEVLAHFGSWRADMATNEVHWSDEQFRLLGYEPGAVQPSMELFLKCVHPDDRERVKKIIAARKDRPDRQNYTCRIICPAGSIKHIYSELVIVRNEQRDCIRKNGFIWDVTERKEAEQKMTESEKKYRHLFENNPLPLVILDTDDHSILDVNEAAIRQYGYNREEFLSLSALDMRPPEDRDRYIKIDRSGERGYIKNGIWKHLRKDGSQIDVEVSSDAIQFEGKSARLILINDITEKIKADNKLRQSEARLKASQRIGNIGGWESGMLNSGSNYDLKWSDEAYRIFGFAPGEIAVSNKLFLKMLHPEDKEAIENAVKEAVEGNGEYSVEHRIIRKDGAIRYVQERGEIIRDEQTGLPVKIEGTIQDITERKEAEALLQRSEANMRTLFNNTDTGYALLDTDLKVLSFNEPVNRFVTEELGKKLKEGTYAISYFNEEKQPIINACLQKALEGQSSSYEVVYPQRNGSDKWYHGSYHPVWNGAEKVLGVIMAITDITERKVSQIQEKMITEDLLQRNKALEQFTYIISHNLRAPVASVMGVANALIEGNIDDADYKVYIEGLSSCIKRLDNVILDLNNILQVKHKINEHKEKVQFSQVVSDIKMNVTNFIDTGMVMIDGDFAEVDEMSTLKSYIHSIFYNLISNSIKYRKPGIVPVIKIKSHKSKNKIELTFKDNSMGIDLAKKGDQVFGLYNRFHPEAAEGKGIGLFMVRTQVETLGGKISVQSKVNEGTEFKIEFQLPDLLN